MKNFGPSGSQTQRPARSPFGPAGGRDTQLVFVAKFVVVDVVVDELVATSSNAASFFAPQKAVLGFLLQLQAFRLQLHRKN